MEPVQLILQALEAGTATDTGYEAVIPDEIRDRYGAFTDLLGEKLADSTSSQAILEQYAAAPDMYEGVLVDMLEEKGITRDVEVLDAARDVLELTDVRGAVKGKYTLDYDDEDLEQFL